MKSYVVPAFFRLEAVDAKAARDHVFGLLDNTFTDYEEAELSAIHVGTLQEVKEFEDVQRCLLVQVLQSSGFEGSFEFPGYLRLPFLDYDINFGDSADNWACDVVGASPALRGRSPFISFDSQLPVTDRDPVRVLGALTGCYALAKVWVLSRGMKAGVKQ